MPTDTAATAAPRRTAGRSSTSLTIIAIVAVLWFLQFAQEVFIPLVLGGLMFYALDPIVDTLQRVKVPRLVGAAVCMLAVVLGVGWTSYSVRGQALAVVENFPKAAANLRAALRPDRGKPEGAINKIQRAATELDKTTAEALPAPAAPQGVVRVQVEEPPLRAAAFVRWGSAQVVAFVSQGLMILLLAYCLLLANDLLKRKLITNFGSTLSRKKITMQILDQIGTQVTRFLLVQAATSVVVAVVTGLALWWLGLEQAIFWGIAAGVLNSIPYLGPIIVTTGLGMVGFMQFGTISMALAVAGVALTITALEGWLLTPALLGRAARMNQVAVFASLILWTFLWGVWGTFLAVPMMVIVKAVCDHVEDFKPWGELLGD